MPRAPQISQFSDVLGEMPPRLPKGDMPDVLVRHAKTLGYGSAREAVRIKPTNLADRFIGELGCSCAGPTNVTIGVKSRAVPVPSRRATSLGHISQVVRVGAQSQVNWVDARRVVALVADAQPLGYRAVGQFPTEAVGPASYAGADHKAPVAESAPAAGPQPALAGSVDLLPEPLDGGPRRAAVRVPH